MQVFSNFSKKNSACIVDPIPIHTIATSASPASRYFDLPYQHHLLLSVMEMDQQSPQEMPQSPPPPPPVLVLPPLSPPNTQVVILHHNTYSRAAKIIMTLAVTAVLIWQIAVMLRHREVSSWCSHKVVVAKEGGADFCSIAAAVKEAPKYSPYRFCIFIRRGVYNEDVFVGPEKTNLVFIGDGIGKTIIKSNRTIEDVQDSAPRATLWINGKGFMAQDLTIESTAGPANNQVVAPENMADQSIFYRCSFMGYNATINAVEKKQFYFIFGGACAIFQKCIINAIKQHPKEKIVMSGQSRRSEAFRTGFVFHPCEFFTIGGVVASPATTYLGGLLAAYSRIVVMQSFLDASIVGWMVNASTPPTVYFGECDNKGPGAKTRTSSPALHSIEDTSLASQFTVTPFLARQNWIPSFVAYNPYLV